MSEINYPLLLKADRLLEAIHTESLSMDMSDYFRMEQDQRKDLEWKAIDKILPASSYGSSDRDMMLWLIRTQSLRLAWIKKWKAKHRNDPRVLKYLGLEYALKSHSILKILYYFATTPLHFFISAINYAKVKRNVRIR